LEYQWKNKKVATDNVAVRLEEFFRERNFETEIDKSNDNVCIVAHRRSASERSRKVKVTISQKIDSLTVKFETAAISRFKSPIYVSLIPLFGGGMLLKKELESSEFYQKLEEDFRRKLDEIVSEYTLK
jgi:hypothetical protein